MALVKKYDQEFPNRFFNEALEYMNINEEEFWQVIDNNRSPHLWKKNDGKWELIHKVN